MIAVRMGRIDVDPTKEILAADHRQVSQRSATTTR